MISVTPRRFLLLFVALESVAVYGDEAPYRIEPEPSFVIRIVQPEFPEEALARGRSGYVDVDAVINPRSYLPEDITYLPDSRDSAIFVEALKEVFPSWKFHLPTRDCLPSHERTTTRVWFERPQEMAVPTTARFGDARRLLRRRLPHAGARMRRDQAALVLQLTTLG